MLMVLFSMENRLAHPGGVTDYDVGSYRETIEALLKFLSKLKFVWSRWAAPNARSQASKGLRLGPRNATCWP